MTPEHPSPTEAAQPRPSRFVVAMGRGAKYGAIAGLIGGTIVTVGAIGIALLHIRIFGGQLVLEGSVLSNVIGAFISVIVVAVGGAITGAVVMGVASLVMGIANLFRRGPRIDP